MTATSPGALMACAQLSLGVPLTSGEPEWRNILERCIAERCAALAWLRSEARIRSDAPAETVGAWQQWLQGHQARMQLQQRVVTESLAWLSAHGVEAIVLKGIPLGMRLYGTAWARPVNDLDLFVPEARCNEATEVLTVGGWRKLRGAPPDDVELVKTVGSETLMLELHSTLSGPWLSALPFPEPRRSDVTIGPRSIPAMSGDFVAPYLASHLLQHGERPLLWLIDFTTLWNSLDGHARNAARAAAVRARLAGALATVEGWSARLTDAAEGDEPAMRAFELDVLVPGSARAVGQLIRASDNLTDAAGIVGHLIRPSTAGGPESTLTLWAHRLARRLHLPTKMADS